MNTLIVGATQCGKSTYEVNRLADWYGAAVVLDPHNSLAVKYMEYLASIGYEHVAYDDLSRLDRCLSWTFLEPSVKTGLEAEKENEDRIRSFAEFLCRRRGLDISKTPLIEEWSIAVLRLWIAQKRPLTDVLHAFHPRTKGFMDLVCGVKGPVSDKFMELRGLTKNAIRGEIGAAARLFEAVLLSPTFAIRSTGGFDFASFLSNGGKIVIGGDRANRDATRMILSAIAQLVIRFVRSTKCPVLLAVDEANNFELIGRPERESLAEDLKMGLRWDILTQTLDFGEHTDAVLTNCGRHEWFRCSADTAKIAAYDIGVASLDPYQVHHVDTKKKQLHDGYDHEKVRTHTTNRGLSTNDPSGVYRVEDVKSFGSESFSEGEMEQARARYMTIQEETVHYQGLNDQILLRQQKIMNQDVGVRYIREGKEVWQEQVIPVESHPWPEVAAEYGPP